MCCMVIPVAVSRSADSFSWTAGIRSDFIQIAHCKAWDPSSRDSDVKVEGNTKVREH